MTLPSDPKERKRIPLATGLLSYFPDALMDIAALSYIGNGQHNPGEPLHWSRPKSNDHPDCMMRHFMERGTVDVDGVRHTTKAAWRMLAILQLEIEADNATDSSTNHGPAAGEPVTGCIDPDAPHWNNYNG
jgi:hypothetical protein